MIKDYLYTYWAKQQAIGKRCFVENKLKSSNWSSWVFIQTPFDFLHGSFHPGQAGIGTHSATIKEGKTAGEENVWVSIVVQITENIRISRRAVVRASKLSQNLKQQ